MAGAAAAVVAGPHPLPPPPLNTRPITRIRNRNGIQYRPALGGDKSHARHPRGLTEYKSAKAELSVEGHDGAPEYVASRPTQIGLGIEKFEVNAVIQTDQV